MAINFAAIRPQQLRGSPKRITRAVQNSRKSPTCRSVATRFWLRHKRESLPDVSGCRISRNQRPWQLHSSPRTKGTLTAVRPGSNRVLGCPCADDLVDVMPERHFGLQRPICRQVQRCCLIPATPISRRTKAETLVGRNLVNQVSRTTLMARLSPRIDTKLQCRR